MRILFLSPRQCWPPLTGAKLREYHLAKALGRHASLTHVSFTQPDAPLPKPADLPFCTQLVPVRQPRKYTVPKIIRGLLGSWPLPIINYYSDHMSAAIKDLLARQQFDLIHLDSVHMGAYIPLIERVSGAPVVFDWHNIESEAMSRYSEGAASTAYRTYAAMTAKRLSRFEEFALGKGMGHAVCSAREQGQLRRKKPDAQVAVIENGVDIAAFDRMPIGFGTRNRLVFVGSMNYHPNVDAALFFTRAVWPRLRDRFPEWRLTFVGSNPSPSVLALRHEAGVEVTGTVEDVRPFYREAIAAIVPLRTGGGTRLKVVEAMAAGTPVVSTAMGAEGIPVIPGENVLIAESREEWIAHLASLASRGGLWDRLSAAGREFARSRYDWSSIGESLYQTYCRWLDARKQ